MTQEELTQVKHMNPGERWRHFKPKVDAKKMTFEQFSRVLNIPYAGGEQAHFESPSDQDPEPHGGDRNVGESKRDDHHGPRSVTALDESSSVVDTIVTAFGGVETTHTDRPRGETQAGRLYDLMSDFEWHLSTEIREKVYGSEELLGARISARIWDLKKYGCNFQSELDHGTIWRFRRVK